MVYVIFAGRVRLYYSRRGDELGCCTTSTCGVLKGSLCLAVAVGFDLVQMKRPAPDSWTGHWYDELDILLDGSMLTGYALITVGGGRWNGSAPWCSCDSKDRGELTKSVTGFWAV